MRHAVGEHAGATDANDLFFNNGRVRSKLYKWCVREKCVAAVRLFGPAAIAAVTVRGYGTVAVQTAKGPATLRGRAPSQRGRLR
jgi:hypothetical protein